MTLETLYARREPTVDTVDTLVRDGVVPESFAKVRNRKPKFDIVLYADAGCTDYVQRIVWNAGYKPTRATKSVRIGNRDFALTWLD